MGISDYHYFGGGGAVDIFLIPWKCAELCEMYFKPSTDLNNYGKIELYMIRRIMGTDHRFWGAG